MPISDRQVHSICRANGQTGAPVCSFLMLGSGWVCAKSAGSESMRQIIEHRRRNNEIRAMGNNCPGWDEKGGKEYEGESVKAPVQNTKPDI